MIPPAGRSSISALGAPCSTALAEAATQRFAPLALLTLLKHPLVRFGEGRGAWLEGARALDRVLRGPRPGAGLTGIDDHLANPSERERRLFGEAAAWWPETTRIVVAHRGRVRGWCAALG